MAAANDTHSPSVCFFNILKLFLISAFSTSSAFFASIPEDIKIPSFLINLPICSVSGIITSASIFATAISKHPLQFFLTISSSSRILA